MKNLIRIGLIFCVLILTNACAFTPQQANLRPSAEVTSESIGNGTIIGLKVLDERSDKSLGHRGSALMTGANISTDQDVAGVIYQAIADGLSKKGFKTIPITDNQGKFLKVEVRLIEYSTSTGFWTGGVHTKSALKAYAVNGKNEYEKLYRSEYEERVVFVPGADENEKLLNQTISGVLTKLFQDQELLGLLVK